MKKWEYKIVEFHAAALNPHGEEGWEAVGITHPVLNPIPSSPPYPPAVPNLGQPVVLMKRPI